MSQYLPWVYDVIMLVRFTLGYTLCSIKEKSRSIENPKEKTKSIETPKEKPKSIKTPSWRVLLRVIKAQDKGCSDSDPLKMSN